MSGDPVIGPFPRDRHTQFDETQWLFDLLHDPRGAQTMIDVGAHLGAVLKPFANSGWKVHAIEPYPPHFDALSQRYRSNRNVVLHKVAISNSTGARIPFYASYESSGINSLTPFRSSHRKIGEVETTTLAHLVDAGAIEQVDFLKIDTEGHDMMALQGFPWSQIKPRIVVCEFEDAKTKPIGYRTEEMARFLENRGYTVLISIWHPIVRYGVPHDWQALQRFPSPLPDETSWGNLIALRDSQDVAPLVESAESYCSFSDGALVAKSIHGANPEQDAKVLSTLLADLRIVVFGAGGSGRIALRSLRKIRCEVLCFADNDSGKQGSDVDGLPVVGVQDLLGKPFDLILIASDYAQEIYRDLISKGLPDEKIRIFHVCIGLEEPD